MLPTTPQTAVSVRMDSEDEFISGMSSEVDLAGEDSEESLGEGKIPISTTLIVGVTYTGDG